ncbi:uncharacterized protein KQ657_003219 [Scheffersomyces spartinae]|uniref:Mitochondrial outer membrane transport complex Sam37/metaxin N-terminal domain-containing protein n=1 Tax=Scheffersomyces spartinae TaxID=45513 RepID=A0A9P7VCU8_9ASCO|nr:uncharacterized protein KQ657_003219 [Scheffersomyces spartinae]KAG7195457.1 hypothetical protein KQ657_003219 [Scheffersomyces spartinae]
MKLHIWGQGIEPSVISPECIASAWLICQVLDSTEFQIVTSNNTNISDIGKLPVLITKDDGKLNGYEDIANYLLKGDNLKGKIIKAEDQVLDFTLMHFLQTRFDALNKYNLYGDTKNYEIYTRKLYPKFLPFPMIYNQPSKLHTEALEQAQLFGLGSKSLGFLGFLGLAKTSDEIIPDTEYINSSQDNDEEEEDYDHDDGKEQKPISSLHEAQLIQKSKKKALLKETRTSIKCMNLLGKYLGQLTILSEKNEFKFGTSERITPSELLFLAYMYALTYDGLPNRFLFQYLSTQKKHILDSVKVPIQDFQKNMEFSTFTQPSSSESPSLWNEILYQFNKLTY